MPAVVLLLAGPLLLLAAVTSAAQPGKKIDIAKATVHQFEDGPAVAGADEFLPGEAVHFSMLLSGYQPAPNERVRISYQFQAFDPAGVPIVEAAAGKIDVELAAQDKNWMPKVRHSFEIPTPADPGVYKVVAAVKDEINGTAATRETPFHVRGKRVEPSDTLVVRNFGFYRGESEEQPMAVAAYRPGAAVWARFDITGYRFAEKNRFAVSYGIEVLRSNGKLLYTQPKAADEQESTFYRKRYLPGVLSLQLDKDIRPDQYTIVLKVTDQVGSQEIESRHVFAVE